jgi:hypothetical protein
VPVGFVSVGIHHRTVWMSDQASDAGASGISIPNALRIAGRMLAALLVAIARCLPSSRARRAFVLAQYMAVDENRGMDISAAGVHDPM